MPRKNYKIYIITTKNGKESRAELEIGDALFEEDPNIKIIRTKFRSVIKLYTALSYDRVLSKLIVHPPATVERVVKVDYCCSLKNDVVNCLLNSLRENEISFGSFRIRRKGDLSKDEVKKIKESLLGLLNKGDNKVLDIEPLEDSVCYGVFKEGLDKSVANARKKLTLY